MGTNHYHRYNHCDCCGRYDERHIGKSWGMFQGYRDEDEKAPVTSWQGWKATLRADGEVWDEYGQQVDVEEFITDVEATDSVRRRRQYDWVRDHHSYGRAMEHDWLDADGFSFTDNEFT
jgi:hypothetical protein